MKFLFTKVPAAIILVPMFLSVLVNTMFPGLVYIGSLTTALFSQSAMLTLTAAVLFFAGTQLRLKEAPEAFRRGGVLLLAKFLTGYVVGTTVTNLFGSTGLFGITTLALFASLLSSNGAIYIAITSVYGDRLDLGAYGMLSVKDGPFLTLLALGASGAVHIPLQSLFAAVFPMILGIVLGNLYEDVRQYFKGGINVLLPLAGISIGSSIDIKLVLEAGISGIALGLIVVLAGGVVLIAADKVILRRPGYAGAALACTAGNAVAIPAIVAGIVPGMQEAAAQASVQIAAAVIVTAILCPLLTSWTIKTWGAPLQESIPSGTKI